MGGGRGAEGEGCSSQRCVHGSIILEAALTPRLFAACSAPAPRPPPSVRSQRLPRRYTSRSARGKVRRQNRRRGEQGSDRRERDGIARRDAVEHAGEEAREGERRDGAQGDSRERERG